MRIIKNIIAQIYIFIGVFLITIFSYLVSFFVNRIQLITLMIALFGTLRKLVFLTVGIKVEYRGLENIPEGACIFASKHQSILETSFLFNTIKTKTVYAFKKEINDVPLWGRLSKKFGGVSIDRGRGVAILNAFIEETKEYLNNGYSVVIFPEGTRTAPKENKKFKQGIAKIYKNINYPVIPVALNTGLILPKSSKTLYPGKVIIEFLPAMPYGLEEQEFLTKIQEDINAKSDVLADETNS